MSLSPNAPTIVSRKETIPRDFIRNWRCSGIRGVKRVARRPKTACVACRMARIKCNGQRDCERCTSRGIACEYVATVNIPEGLEKSHQTNQEPSNRLLQNDKVAMNSRGNTTDRIHTDNDTYGRTLATGSHWVDKLPEPRAEHDNVVTPQTNQDVFSSTIHSGPADMSFMQNLLDTPPSTQATPQYHSDPLNTSSPCSVYIASTLQQSDNISLDDCLCRAHLALLSPKIHRAIREKRLDEAFKITGDIIKSARNILDCASCEVNCADLISILAVFQQTNTCWEHITEVDLFGGIKVTIGNYEVPVVNKTELRRILIVDLIKQAKLLLESLHALGQNVSMFQHERGRLTQVNLIYLQVVTDNFSNVFGSIMNYFNEPLEYDIMGPVKGTETR